MEKQVLQPVGDAAWEAYKAAVDREIAQASQAPSMVPAGPYAPPRFTAVYLPRRW